MKRDPITLLPFVLIASGVFDVIGGIAFTVGFDRVISQPSTHPFYAGMIATFLFSMAFLQFVAARNVRRYVVAVGVVTISRVLFGVLFFAFLLAVDGFPQNLLPTAIADIVWSLIYIGILLRSSEVGLRDAFVPVPASRGSDVPV